MHWKVLCVDPSSVVCVCIACALDPTPTRVRRVRLCTGHEGVVGWEGKQATAVPCIVILLEQGCWGGTLDWDMFYGNHQCLQFCSPLCVNLKFFFLKDGFGFNSFFKKMIKFSSSWSFLTFLKCIFLRKGSAFIKTVHSCKIFLLQVGWF